MNYSEVSLNSYLIDPCLTLYRIDETEDRINLYAKSKKHLCACPKCQTISDEQHSTYTRRCFIMPLRSKTTEVHMIASTYECCNPECKQKYFAEPMETVGRFDRYSYDVQILMFALSVFVSARGTASIMKLLGVPVSHDTVQDLYESMEIKDDPDIEEIGVDDVANRKGQSYFTAIYSLKDHSMVALLDGRDGETLKTWLKEHRKVRVVARDRASAYASAIKEVLGDGCMQVADRFHLLKNLLDTLRDLFKDQLPKYFFIRDGKLLEEEPSKEKVPAVPFDSKEFDMLSYDNSEPPDQDGNPVCFDRKLINYDSSYYRKMAMNRIENTQKAIDVRADALHSEDPFPDIKKLSETHSISGYMVKKYLSLSDDEVISMIMPKEQPARSSPFDAYVNVVYKMLRDGYKPEFIFSYLIHNGCEIKPSVLSVYIGLIAKNNFGFKPVRDYPYRWTYPPDVTVIRRNDLVKYISAKNRECETVKEVEQYFPLICASYPIVRETEQIYVIFHFILMGDSPGEMDQFINQYGNSPLSSFITGLKKDMAAVKNAISSDISSGFVEGNNTKFKLIKRILAGRSGLSNLFRKCYAAFSITHRSAAPRDLLGL